MAQAEAPVWRAQTAESGTVISIGIVEDDPASSALLVNYLRQYEHEHEHDEKFAVTQFADGAELVAGYRADMDILLLDVEMPGLDGFSAAQRIRQVDPDVLLIFITNMTQCAIHGYEVDALSYVLKPVLYFAFSQEIKRSADGRTFVSWPRSGRLKRFTGGEGRHQSIGRMHHGAAHDLESDGVLRGGVDLRDPR